jgi:hypothetical protein
MHRENLLERGTGRGRVDSKRNVVTAMDDDFRELLETNKARADEVRSQLAERQAHCIHRDDGYSCDWAKTMPKKEPPPTIEEVRQEIADAVAEIRAEQPNALTAAEIEDALGQVVSHQRKYFGAEIAKLRAEIGELRADLTIQKAHASGEIVEPFRSPRRA